MIRRTHTTTYAITLLLLHGTSHASGTCPSAVCAGGDVCNRPCHTIKRYPIRPQGRSKDRQMVGTARYTHDDCDNPLKFCMTTTTQYARSYKPLQILEYLFGGDVRTELVGTSAECYPDCCRTIHIQGSKIANRDPNAWFADYFYLPRDFDSFVSFNPRITNFIVDFDLYAHLNSCLSGLYIRLYGPVVHAQWDLNMCESASLNANEPDTGDCKAGDTDRPGYPTGYFATVRIKKSKLLQCFTAYAGGATPADDYETGMDQTCEDRINEEDPAHHITFQPLNAIRMTPCVQKKTGIADVRFELGWNVLCDDDSHLGLNIQGAAPSGKRPDPLYLFDPIIGNGKHWEVGAGLTGHYTIIKNRADTCHFVFHLDANLTYILKANETRTFDLKDKPNSSYMLAACYRENNGGTPFQQLHVLGQGDVCGPTPSHLFALEYAPVANLTTLNVQTSNDLHVDLVGMLSIYTPRFSIDFGYNYWARSVETINLRDSYENCFPRVSTVCQKSKNCEKWGLKGDARMFGYYTTDTEAPFTYHPQALSATEGKPFRDHVTGTIYVADIHHGKNQTPLDFDLNLDINRRIDNLDPANICDGDTAYPLINEPYGEPTAQVRTSYEPVFLSADQVDLVAPRQMSHKLFAHCSFVCDRDNWSPYLGIGCFVEMGRNKDCTRYPGNPCNMPSRVDCALSQWSVWFKTGLAFE